MKPDIQTETQKPENSQWRSSVNTLLLNAGFIDNLGLMHGKIGISILFYHLARKYTTVIYDSIFKFIIE
jgi:hypothetical protein